VILVLIIGADVTHPGIESKVNSKITQTQFMLILIVVCLQFPSLAAVTASLDRTGMPFQMHIQAQRRPEKGAAEVITGLGEIMKSFITTFVTKTGHKPRKILYYRDGVGDGQFGEVSSKSPSSNFPPPRSSSSF